MIKAIIIDDESKARDLLAYLLQEAPREVQILGKYATLLEGVEGIKKHCPDVIFLDIEMPQVSGVKILEYIPEPDFEIIFATAYDNYAIQAFELSALDYLLKPINKEKLFNSLDKVGEKLDTKARLQLYEQNKQAENPLKICLPSLEGNHIVLVNSILAVEANRSYCIVHTKTKKYILSRSLSVFADRYMPLANMKRVHRSWIVNTTHIKAIKTKTKEISLNHKELTIPVSRRYWKDVQTFLV